MRRVTLLSRARERAVLCIVVCCVLPYGCGTVGEPMYPSLNIPVRITDLHVVEHASVLLIDFTIPNQTTDGVIVKTVRGVELRVGDREVPVDKNQPGLVHVQMPVEGLVGKDVLVHVRLIGAKGHASDWSNRVNLTVLPPLPAPSQLKADGVPEGVKVTWAAPGAKHFRIFRLADKETKATLAGESDAPEYMDKTTEYGKTYQYSVQGVNGTAESGISDTTSITPTDKFPPAVPTGLTASPGINSVELAWDRNTEPDFKGYRVYRSVENGAFERVAEMLEGPSYSDKNVETGKRYRYTVSAVDQAGNESNQSGPVEIAVE